MQFLKIVWEKENYEDFKAINIFTIPQKLEIVILY